MKESCPSEEYLARKGRNYAYIMLVSGSIMEVELCVQYPKTNKDCMFSRRKQTFLCALCKKTNKFLGREPTPGVYE